MENLVQINYERDENIKTTNELGMREMQAKAYEKRNSQYLLLKSPPASGKSRALMFLALDKLYNQGIKKVIVSVPEQSIGSSFKSTDLKSYGFYYDWEVNPRYNLCHSIGNKNKSQLFKEFLESDEQVLVCPHATLRNAFNSLDISKFNDCLLAIDEFHHVSSDDGNKLGELLRDVMNYTNAHVIAMTGSYFRGDTKLVLRPEDEAKFEKVTYNYYQQMKSYKYLKSIGIGYHFYQGPYYESLEDVLDTDKKTIIHIPNVNSRESTKKKYEEVGHIMDVIGKYDKKDEHGIHHLISRKNGKSLKVADLVEEKDREKVMEYVKSVKSVDDLDIIIALGMAKEGFDWPYCESTLTIGYRGSMTEIIQIIGRCTRDSENKTHAQFTNLLAEPDIEDSEVKTSVNNMLKAISASLLMKQVLAPNLKFKISHGSDDAPEPGTVTIKGMGELSSKRTKEIVENDMVDLTATILQRPEVQNIIASSESDELKAAILNKTFVPKIIAEVYPDLTPNEVEEVRQRVVANAVLTGAEFVDNNPDSTDSEETVTNSNENNNGENIVDPKENEVKKNDMRFIQFANKFVKIDELHIDLIDTVNPFREAYEILSKDFTASMLKAIKEVIDTKEIEMSPEEARDLYPLIGEFKKEHGRLPNHESSNPDERRLGQAILLLKKLRKQHLKEKAGE